MKAITYKIEKVMRTIVVSLIIVLALSGITKAGNFSSQAINENDCTSGPILSCVDGESLLKTPFRFPHVFRKRRWQIKHITRIQLDYEVFQEAQRLINPVIPIY